VVLATVSVQFQKRSEKREARLKCIDTPREVPYYF
jgi:hypothetical protein